VHELAPGPRTARRNVRPSPPEPQPRSLRILAASIPATPSLITSDMMWTQLQVCKRPQLFAGQLLPNATLAVPPPRCLPPNNLLHPLMPPLHGCWRYRSGHDRGIHRYLCPPPPPPCVQRGWLKPCSMQPRKRPDTSCICAFVDREYQGMRREH